MARLTSLDKWTEGPWRATVETSVIDGMTVTICNVSPDADDDGRLQDYGHSILEGGGLVCESDEENLANAHMLAAAPEMYDVLGKVRDTLVKEGVWRRDGFMYVSVLIEMARATARGHHFREAGDDI